MSRIQQGYSAYLTSMKTTSNMHALSSHVSSAIKPSVCFLNLPREAAKIHGTPPDMIDGPSPLQKLGNEITLKDRFHKTVFEVEREDHEGVKPEKLDSLREARSSLFLTLGGQQPQLKSPKEQRDDLYNIRRKLSEYNEFKVKQKELGRRERIFKTCWRHGITGVENADAKDNSVFYRETKQMRDKRQSQADILNDTRKERK